MTRSRNKVVAWFLLIAMTLTMLLGGLAVHADYTEGTTPLDTLCRTAKTGKYVYISGGKTYDFSTNRYKNSKGGYVMYTALFTDLQGSRSGLKDIFNNDAFTALKPSAKQDFLGDVFTICTAVIADTTAGYNATDISKAPTDDTMNDFMTLVQQQSGMGSSLLATLMQNTKPNYAAANRLYQPFSGTVGTILGVVSIIVMALLGITMAFDIAYIVIPAFQMAMGGGESGGNGDGKGKGGLSGIISMEAKKAVQAADGGSGGQSGSGEYKAAVGIYFKYRWKGLVLLGICLLYLVQGQIYSFVGWFIDLFSGFLGF